jgi:hypothetical protein
MMQKYCLAFSIVLVCLLTGCTQPISTEAIDKDIADIKSSITLLQTQYDNNSSENIRRLIESNIWILKNTESMLEQKKKGLNRFIKVTYSIDGKGYESTSPSANTVLLDEGISSIDADIQKAVTESNQYSGGAIKTIIEYRIASMTLTKTVLHQKLLSVKNGIPLYLPTPTQMSEDSINTSLAGVDADLKRIREEIAFAQNESDQYSGGAIKVLLEIKIATMKLSESLLEQKKVCLANGLPVYLPAASSGSTEREKRIPMKGSILDNL